MAVKKKVNDSINSFIDKGANVKATKERGFKNVLIRIPENFLTEIEEALEKKPWLTRTQWVVEAIHEKLSANDKVML